MSYSIVIDGDTAKFNSAFGQAIVIADPGVIKGTGDAMKYRGKAVCVQGDEKSVKVVGCSYMTPKYSIAGKGTVTIESLDPSQINSSVKVGSKSTLMASPKPFKAKLEVSQAAKEPPGIPGSTSSSDPIASYSGAGAFKSDCEFKGFSY